MGEYKRKFGVYAAWNYELKLEEFNAMSEQGWQLLDVGLFSRRYKKNTEVQYRYQMDFHPGIEDKGRYLETYREQGWEYVSTSFNGWYYFRKLYDQSLLQEEYEIFTDTPSSIRSNLAISASSAASPASVKQYRRFRSSPVPSDIISLIQPFFIILLVAPYMVPEPMVTSPFDNCDVICMIP